MKWFYTFLIVIGVAMSIRAEEVAPTKDCQSANQYTFSWSIHTECGMTPRGGTSKGGAVVRDPNPNPGWLSLQEAGISDFERDRRAILAMAGPYRVSFDFLETVGFTTTHTPARPYQSWGTEFVYVAEDSGDFISLQHIMVMVFEQEDGSLSKPMVMKHWRQDWQYEKQDLFVYTGHDTWSHHTLSKKEAKGTWAQSVYQVDDSPRYESFGKWVHHANMSSWKSGQTWRPLPRREASVRQDYHVLEGTNTHVILPSGWVQEEENMKLVLDEHGKPHATTPYLAKELGLARYERIVNHDFSEGDKYWQLTKGYWSDVKSVWASLIKNSDKIKVNKRVNNQIMFMPFFAQAESVVNGEATPGKEDIKATLLEFVELNNE